jgi:hypothetical protein
MTTADISVTVPTLVIALPLMAIVCVCWWLLGRWLLEAVDPHVRRWLWRRCGGTGRPPTDEEIEQILAQARRDRNK